MDIFKGGSRPTRIAPASYFTGAVMQEPILEAPEPARLRATIATFAPGARTAWHTHPLGQTLYIVSGTGRVQSRGGPVREVRAGDVVWFAPGELHWHGAAPANAMVHLAMQEEQDGSYVSWQEHVSDEEYGAPPQG